MLFQEKYVGIAILSLFIFVFPVHKLMLDKMDTLESDGNAESY